MRVVQEGGEELEELQLAQSHLGVNCRGRRECVNIYHHQLVMLAMVHDLWSDSSMEF